MAERLSIIVNKWINLMNQQRNWNQSKAGWIFSGINTWTNLLDQSFIYHPLGQYWNQSFGSWTSILCTSKQGWISICFFSESYWQQQPPQNILCRKQIMTMTMMLTMMMVITYGCTNTEPYLLRLEAARLSLEVEAPPASPPPCHAHLFKRFLLLLLQ